MLIPEHNVFAVTDRGRVRDHNEDACHISADGKLLVVADGMGGHEAGEVAAALAIKAIAEHLSPERLTAETSEAEIGSLLSSTVAVAHARVFEENQMRRYERPMGCTLIVAHVSKVLVTCHVGDVRCYVFSNGLLHQITRDHSTVGALVEAGQLSPEQARVHPNKNEVLQAIGMPEGIVPELNRLDLQAHDRILLCSDGLWETLSQDEIHTILASDGNVRQLTTQLVDRANDAGGFDNITAVLFEVPTFVQTGIH